MSAPRKLSRSDAFSLVGFGDIDAEGRPQGSPDFEPFPRPPSNSQSLTLSPRYRRIFLSQRLGSNPSATSTASTQVSTSPGGSAMSACCASGGRQKPCPTQSSHRSASTRVVGFTPTL